MNIVARKKPVTQKVYSLRDLIETLELQESPFLMVTIDGYQCLIQSSHITDEDLLAIPGMDETYWKYLRTTNEWIPIFIAVGDAVMACIDYEKAEDSTDFWWVTPKGFYYNQHS